MQPTQPPYAFGFRRLVAADVGQTTMKQINEKENEITCDAKASDYIEYARKINAIAKSILNLETRNTDWLAGKISLGLSLQAAELAGKGILRTLGHSVIDIRNQHRKHNVLALLQQVEKELQNRPEESLTQYHHFLLRTPEINGTRYNTTIGKYLSEHFSRGSSAYSRNYFYPDVPVFTGPVPIQALAIMVEHIIVVGREVIAIIAGNQNNKTSQACDCKHEE